MGLSPCRQLQRDSYYSVLILTACAPVAVTETGPTPTAVIAGEVATQPPVQVEALPKPTIAPFRFFLPTPGAEPVSGWRPPLYPVPWAVSAYDHFYFARPIAADNVNWPLAEYRYGAVFFAPNIVHTGVDIDAEEGTPILAAGAAPSSQRTGAYIQKHPAIFRTHMGRLWS